MAHDVQQILSLDPGRPLHEAVRDGLVDSVADILRNGISVDSVDEQARAVI